MNKINKKIQISGGFTIVELLIVVVVIAILATITLVSFNGVTTRANDVAAKSMADQAGDKALVHKTFSDDNTYPADKNELGITDSKVTYVSYDNGTRFCASGVSGNANYFVSNYQTSPAVGACEGAAVNGQVCPSGYIPVPGDSRFGTKAFCVMKYEAKNVGSVAVSVATGIPWDSITQTSAISTSSSACAGCHLITEPEWMTIAANILSVPENWSGKEVGVGYVFRGHSDNVPANPLVASTDDTDGYNGTGDTSGNQKRTHILSNGATIWDFSGNTSEFTNATITGGQPGLATDEATGATYSTKQWNDSALLYNSLPAVSRPVTINAQAATYGSNESVGLIYSNQNQPATRAYLRGGNRGNGSGAGVLSLYFMVSPSAASATIGFRVAK